MKKCRKKCHRTKAKAMKAIRRMSGRRSKPAEVTAYQCLHPEHEGVWHLTSHRETEYAKHEEALRFNQTLAPGSV